MDFIWSPNWVHSARRPLNGLLYLPRVIVMMENFWWNEDWQGKPKYSEKTCPSATLSTTNPTCQTRAAAVGSQLLTGTALCTLLTIQVLELHCSILLQCADLTSRFAFVPSLFNVGYYSLVVSSLLSLHVSAQPVIIRCTGCSDERIFSRPSAHRWQ
jgi:hypothetical protein